MLRGGREMFGWPIVAEDDEVGRLSDVYFDDWRWTVRYFVVHTSHWPVGRGVLISPRSVDGVEAGGRRRSAPQERSSDQGLLRARA